jgi:hypothetical protein
MNPVLVRQQLHEIVDQLPEPEVERVLQFAQSELEQPSDLPRPWPQSIGAIDSGLGDLASNPDKYLAESFGR